LEKAASQSAVPSSDILAKAVAQVQQPHWTLDASNQTATHLSDAPIKLNSFAKSYIIKSAADAALAAAKLSGILVNIGGDMVISGDMNETVLISNPKADAENDAPIDQLMIHDKAIATSGNYRRGEMINGKWYSHIVDPRTGLTADGILSATVVAKDATVAGSLATAFNVMSPAESIALANQMTDIDYLIITRDGQKFESKHWHELQIATTKENLEISSPAVTNASNLTATTAPLSGQKEWKMK